MILTEFINKKNNCKYVSARTRMTAKYKKKREGKDGDNEEN